ncbi:MAG TPA: hypothetical protein IGS52_19940 [Oscillatoriaceae cyanobacterium M33_DOE_052]|nr:hypothetical protein [Oscillatoriaceae cyanobacterium M33_DOE_052]
MEGFGAIFMRYYSAIFLSGILFSAGGYSFLSSNTIATNIPDSVVSVQAASGVNPDTDMQPHRGSGR